MSFDSFNPSFSIGTFFIGIPLTIQSNRPSSRSSQRSSGSIGSYTGRRSSGAPQKGVAVSQSRQGAARSAAILLYSYHLNNLRDETSLFSQNFNSNKFMATYIEQQLEDQKKLLYLDIPTLRNHSTLMRKLHLNPRSEIDLTLLSTGSSPLHKRFHRKFLKHSTSHKDTAAVVVVDERSGVDGMFVNKSTEGCDLNGSSNSDTHNVSFITEGGYTNPLAYSINDLDGDSDDDYDSDEGYQQSFLFDNQEVFFGAMPTPCSEGPSIAVWKINEMKTNDRCHKLSLSVLPVLFVVSLSTVNLGRIDELLLLLVFIPHPY